MFIFPLSSSSFQKFDLQVDLISYFYKFLQMSQYLKQKDKCLRKSCSIHRLVFTRMLKNILWLWFIPWCFYTFLHCTHSWFSLSDDFPSSDAIALRKFSDLFHKSFHLSPCVMLSVFKAVSILSSSSMPALLHGLAPSYTKPCCLQTAKHFAEAISAFMLQGKVLYFFSSLQPFIGMLWQ